MLKPTQVRPFSSSSKKIFATWSWMAPTAPSKALCHVPAQTWTLASLVSGLPSTSFEFSHDQSYKGCAALLIICYTTALLVIVTYSCIHVALALLMVSNYSLQGQH